MAEQGLQFQTCISAEGELTLSLVNVDFPDPKEDEVLVRVDAAPINPSDLGLLFGPADITAATYSEVDGRPSVTAMVPEAMRRHIGARAGHAMPAGNEGAGVVIQAGSSDAAQQLMGKTVAVLGGAMYSQYRVLKVSQCLLMNEGVSAKQGASCFVNPLTALGMVETMRQEGHTALLHTAAASNLGQMLVKICLKDGVELVNVVRKQEHVDLLKDIGAAHALNSSDPGFMADLVSALTAISAGSFARSIFSRSIITDVSRRPRTIRGLGTRGYVLIDVCVYVVAKTNWIDARSICKHCSNGNGRNESIATKWCEFAHWSAIARHDECFAVIETAHDVATVVSELALCDYR